MTQSMQKIMNYLLDYVESEDFQLQIKNLRKKVGIPEEGLPYTLSDKDTFRARSLFYMPEGVTQAQAKRANLGLREITKDFPVRELDITIGFRMYFFHNQIFMDNFEDGIFFSNLCKIVDLRGDFQEYAPIYEERMENLIKHYPVAILLRPETSQRDVVEYVKRAWDYLESMKEPYLDPHTRVGKTRKKNPKIKARNDFIYENRALPRKEIASMVAKKFGDFMDHGSVGKIVSLETKRRKKV